MVRKPDPLLGVRNRSASKSKTGDDCEPESMGKNERFCQDEKDSNNNPNKLKEKGEADAAEESSLLSFRSSSSSSHKQSYVRRFSRQFSRELLRRSSSLKDQLPETPAGWAVLFSVLCSAGLGYEVQLQKSLTCPPLVYGQIVQDSPIKAIYDKLTESPESILSRDIQPSLFVGTNKLTSTMVACIPNKGPSLKQQIQFRQILTMSHDGATIALDWELPSEVVVGKINHDSTKRTTPLSTEERKKEILHGPIQQPVILILHGVFNDSTYWYVRSLQRACTDRGWVAVGMNYRGCGGIPITTPRSFNSSFTGDIRFVVQHIAARLKEGTHLLIVGFSLGGNLICKYLGEEGLNGTLPKCVVGAVSCGNALDVHGKHLNSPMKELMAFGVKQNLLYHWFSLRKFTDTHFQKELRKLMLLTDVNDIEQLCFSQYIRNEQVAPYPVRIGFQTCEEYWGEASSYKLIRNVSIPLMQLIAGDDFIVAKPFYTKLRYMVMNPNIITVTTRCGGHLGWQESPPGQSTFGTSTSWADQATIDFIDAVLSTHDAKSNENNSDAAFVSALNECKEKDNFQSKLQMMSRL